MEEMAFHRALESIFVALDKTNQYIVQTAPVTLIKEPDQKARVGEILHHVLEGVRITGELLAPFLPETGAAVRNLLGLPAGDTPPDRVGGFLFPKDTRSNRPKCSSPGSRKRKATATGARRRIPLGYGNDTDTRIVIPAKAAV